MQLGKVVVDSVCPICGHPMVLRTSRVDGGYFLGCTQFATKDCQGTRRYEDVVHPDAKGGGYRPA